MLDFLAMPAQAVASVAAPSAMNSRGFGGLPRA